MRPRPRLTIRAASARFLAWQSLPTSNVRDLARAVAAAQEIPASIPLEALQVADLPFYPGCQIAALSFAGLDHDGFVITRDATVLLDSHLDGINEPIYRVNEALPIHLTDVTVGLYARFFFHFVRGAGTRFNIVETEEDIPWRAGAPAEQRAEAATEVMPLINLGKDASGCIHLTSTMLFRTALFRSDILVATVPTTREVDEELTDLPLGGVALDNEVLLLENLDIITDVTDA